MAKNIKKISKPHKEFAHWLIFEAESCLNKIYRDKFYLENNALELEAQKILKEIEDKLISLFKINEVKTDSPYIDLSFQHLKNTISFYYFNQMILGTEDTYIQLSPQINDFLDSLESIRHLIGAYDTEKETNLFLFLERLLESKSKHENPTSAMQKFQRTVDIFFHELSRMKRAKVSTASYVTMLNKTKKPHLYDAVNEIAMYWTQHLGHKFSPSFREVLAYTEGGRMKNGKISKILNH